ncbi:MAG: hypothetical protein ACR2LL_09160 [Nitrosopumilus sp.]
MYSFIVFFPLLLSTAFGEPVPNYNDPYSPIFTDKPSYSWTDKIKMKIIAPSWNSDRHLIDSIGDIEDNPIKISTRENSLEHYRFTETDVNSGYLLLRLFSQASLMMLMVMENLILLQEQWAVVLLTDFYK